MTPEPSPLSVRMLTTAGPTPWATAIVARWRSEPSPALADAGAGCRASAGTAITGGLGAGWVTAAGAATLVAIGPWSVPPTKEPAISRATATAPHPED